MRFGDWTALCVYFVVMVLIGAWARRRVKTAADFFTAGGRLPSWLAGISHHMSGYSAAVFVAYAAIAYTNGFALYVWWSLSIFVGCTVCAFVFAPRWPRLRQRLGVVSPLEFLAVRYNISTQQVLAWSGAALKVFDVAAKWTASAILLNVFADVPITGGILLTGSVTLVYAAVGGLWADVLTDFGQFIIQLAAGIAMLVAVMSELGGFSSIWTIWDKLPPSHSHAFSSPYTPWFFVAYCVISTVSYSGGTWSLAQRLIASPDSAAAKRASLLSAGLYLVWPLVLFFPMWAAPLILPNLKDPSQSYALLVTHLLPQGLIGLVLAGMFSHTMAMTSSDANAISAVVVRDIVPRLMGRSTPLPEQRGELLAGRVSTVLFIGLSMTLAATSDSFGGVFGLLVLWFGALVGPIAIPMLLGMLPAFRRCGPAAALLSWAAGLGVFALDKYGIDGWIAGLSESQAITVGLPVLVSIVVFVGVGLIAPVTRPEADELLDAINGPETVTERRPVLARDGLAS